MKEPRTIEDLGVALAYCRGELTWQTIRTVKQLQAKSQPGVDYWVGATLRWAVREGLLVRNTDAPHFTTHTPEKGQRSATG